MFWPIMGSAHGPNQLFLFLNHDMFSHAWVMYTIGARGYMEEIAIFILLTVSII